MYKIEHNAIDLFWAWSLKRCIDVVSSLDSSRGAFVGKRQFHCFGGCVEIQCLFIGAWTVVVLGEKKELTTKLIRNWCVFQVLPQQKRTEVWECRDGFCFAKVSIDELDAVADVWIVVGGYQIAQ